jgi:hypothetical protein
MPASGVADRPPLGRLRSQASKRSGFGLPVGSFAITSVEMIWFRLACGSFAITSVETISQAGRNA